MGAAPSAAGRRRLRRSGGLCACASCRWAWSASSSCRRSIAARSSCSHYPTGTPLTTATPAIAALAARFSQTPRRPVADGAVGRDAVELRRAAVQGSVGQITSSSRQTAATRPTTGRRAGRIARQARTDRASRRDPGDRHGRRQRAADRLPDHLDARRTRCLRGNRSRSARETPGTANVNSSAARSRRRSTSTSIATARARWTSTSARRPAAFARRSAVRWPRSSTTTRGTKYVQVLYPRVVPDEPGDG